MTATPYSFHYLLNLIIMFEIYGHHQNTLMRRGETISFVYINEINHFHGYRQHQHLDLSSFLLFQFIIKNFYYISFLFFWSSHLTEPCRYRTKTSWNQSFQANIWLSLKRSHILFSANQNCFLWNQLLYLR